MSFSFQLPESAFIDSNRFGSLLNLSDYWNLLVAGYLVIACALLAYLLIGLAKLFRISENSRAVSDTALALNFQKLTSANGINRDIALLVSNKISSPVTFGILKHQIIFPEDYVEWPPALQKQALSHELGHIMRGDWLQQMIARTVMCIYWFNPLVWIAYRDFHLASEMACDDIAIDDAGNSIEYAESLLWLASSTAAKAQCAMALFSVRGSELSQRIRHILDSNTKHKYIDRNGCIPNISLAIAFSAVLAAMSINFIKKENTPLASITIPVHFYSIESVESQLFRDELEKLRFELR